MLPHFKFPGHTTKGSRVTCKCGTIRKINIIKLNEVTVTVRFFPFLSYFLRVLAQN